MLPEHWLIDGYNVLHDIRAGGGRKTPPSREAFFSRLAGFASAGPRRVLVVLDGVGPDEEWGAASTPYFSVVYSQKVTADSYIERFLCEKKGAFQFTVVTKDRAVTAMARGSGARVMGADEFLALVADGGKDNDEALLREKVKSRGFHRPFGGLKSPGAP